MSKHWEICKIVIIYALFGSAWIYFSDTALSWLVHDPAIMTKLAIFKGLLYIITTSVLLYFLIARLDSKIKQSISALRASEERLRLLVKNSSDCLVIFNADGRQRYASPAAERISGYPVEELIGKSLDLLIHPDDLPLVTDAWQEAVDHPERTVTVQFRHIHKTREWVYFEAVSQSFLDEPAINGIIASVRDITEHKKADEENQRLQLQLTQAQKMETVGRLAGGVAHDFNNMLSVILGYAEMTQDRLGPDHPVFADLREIGKAAGRSADLTRQLLAFARKQTVAPKVLDLNETVGGMLKMLKRLIGENIELAWLPGPSPWLIKMDPTQIDQVLANLCINARDAIGDTGKVTIETTTVAIDDADCTLHSDCYPGEYVVLVVSDSGCGMPPETISHLFEPFYTTKEIGRGTGLGLATVYGIVKQNHGFINVYSEPNKGSSFKIYLPRHIAGDELSIKSDALLQDARGNETILLVEDEPAILKMTMTMLSLQGYTVLPAATAGEAIRLAGEYAGKIHLLMTDVIMPEMNGRELAKQVVGLHPDLKLIFMSGYTSNVIAHHGVLDEGVNFIQKPFTKKELAAKIREVFDGNPQ
ncbi:MAG: PAS domain S-box protein [Desulforhopalus sp.]|nr:PAS domain S-box protein [Desulforhopalus sp.]